MNRYNTAIAIGFVCGLLTYLAIHSVFHKAVPWSAPRCWAAPPEAIRHEDSAIGGSWLLDQHNGQPIYCVEWLGDFGMMGRPTLATRCWPALPMSEDACKQSPVP